MAIETALRPRSRRRLENNYKCDGRETEFPISKLDVSGGGNHHDEHLQCCDVLLEMNLEVASGMFAKVIRHFMFTP